MGHSGDVGWGMGYGMEYRTGNGVWDGEWGTGGVWDREWGAGWGTEYGMEKGIWDVEWGMEGYGIGNRVQDGEGGMGWGMG